MPPTANKSTTEALLGILSLAPRTGYEVRRFMEQSTSNFWSESFGQIYPALKKLESEGLVATTEADGLGHPRKKRYRLSAKGSTKLTAWLSETPRPQVPRNELLLKLFFGDQAEQGTMTAHVKQRRAKAQTDLAHYEAMINELETEFGKKSKAHPGLPYWLMTLRYGVADATAIIDWCEATLKELKRLDADYKKRSNQKI